MIDKFTHHTYKDERGSYTAISTHLSDINWDQCSISINDNPYTFRGLHYQTNPPQTKYVKVIQGRIIDFLLDLNTNEVEHVIMEDNNAILIPNNKAHGFLTLEKNTVVAYMVSGGYDPASEHSIVWNKIPEVAKIINEAKGNNPIVISYKDQIGK